MAEQAGPTSIAARIAALKIDQVGRAPGAPPPLKKKPFIDVAAKPEAHPERPEFPGRQQSINVPPLNTHASAAGGEIGNQPANGRTNGYAPQSNASGTPSIPMRPVKAPPPALPPRKLSGPAPQLPPRRPSEMSLEPPPRPDSGRRLSTDSTASAMSSKSSISRVSTRTGTSVGTTSSGPLYAIKAPEYDQSKLPPLPPKREPSDPQTPRAPLKTNKSSPSVLPAAAKLPPLPSRVPSQEPRPVQPARPRQSVLTMGFNNAASEPPPVPRQSASAPPSGSVPPPIPVGSRPDLTKLLASKPKTNGTSATGTASASVATSESCLKCRDFSAVDAHAARFPRESIPSTDLGWLAHQLTSPFPSLTDKARAIFTWLHHNVNYDTVAFFSNNVRGSTPAGTLSTGLAVCEGYAGLFTALASKCGLESVVVGGHGKGGTYSQPGPGSPLPPFSPTGHAWNAVRIDNGQWKLIDCCWGAGTVDGGAQAYTRGFSPGHFTRDNNDFGLSHYPSDKRHFYREDGRPSISWEEYILGPSNGALPPQMFGGYTGEEGIAVESFQPLGRKISVQDSQPYIRFQFSKVCSHYNNEKNGKGKHYLYILETGGVDGRTPKNIPFESNGMFWWVDVKPRELGAAGQQVKIAAVNSFDNRDGRGVKPAEFNERLGRVAMGWGYVALYELI